MTFLAALVDKYDVVTDFPFTISIITKIPQLNHIEDTGELKVCFQDFDILNNFGVDSVDQQNIFVEKRATKSSKTTIFEPFPTYQDAD